METKEIIKTFDLTKVYGKETAVDHLNFAVREGEIFGFLGPNGAGKTTTLLMLLGLSEPTYGRAFVAGYDPVREPLEIKKVVGYLPENVGFYHDLSPVETLQFIGELNELPHRELQRRIDELLTMVGLSKDRYKKVGAFSRGMKQRLGIAEVLIKEPKVLFLDEPTLGLDPEGSRDLIELIKRLNQEKGITVLVSSHNLPQVEEISHRIGVMIMGRLIAVGSMEELGREKLGVGEGEYSLEELYHLYFEEEGNERVRTYN
ncbi:MAG: ABC transporter ATP-binding protein [Desulfatiglandales bacterium]